MSRSRIIQGTPIERFCCKYSRRIVLAIFLVVALSACQPTDDSGSSPTNADGQPAEATLDPNAIQSDWDGSPHADTYVVDLNNENNACAQCHAPVSFVPSMDDIPSGCFSCKFEIEDPLPFIPETEWTPIECRVCHEVDRNNNVSSEFKWLEIAAIDEYAEVETASDLCLNCHTGSEMSDHQAIEVIGVHEALVCTECHDAHTTYSSCSSSGCHDDWQSIEPAIAGHDADHQNVSCVACHDASDLDVGPGEDADEQWHAFVSYSADGETITTPFSSHNIQREVSCDRCHFSDNPWDLASDIEAVPAS